MTTVVCFHCAGASYCLPVDSIRSVRLSDDIVALPAASTDVAGVIPGDPPLTVIAPLHGGGGQILVLEVGKATFGLLVDGVTGLRRIAEAEIHPAPTGQSLPLIRGTVNSGTGLLLVADQAALASRL
jgi:chemotaxis signal transduction protein